jgi:hypothetical protein
VVTVHVAGIDADTRNFSVFWGACSCGWRSRTGWRTPDIAQRIADAHVADSSFYVKRTILQPQTLSIEAGVVAWTGPINDDEQAEAERRTWEDAGWLAVVVPSTPASRELVERWQRLADERHGR